MCLRKVESGCPAYFLTLVEKLGASSTFLLYVIASVASRLFAYYFVPETKGRTLEQIDAFWRAKHRALWIVNWRSSESGPPIAPRIKSSDKINTTVRDCAVSPDQAPGRWGRFEWD